MRKVFILLSVLLLISCSAKEESESSSLMETGIYPDLIMENTSAQVGQEDASPITLNAGKMTLYSKDGYARLEDFNFTSYNEEGEVETEGSAEKGKIELDGSRIELEGKVTFSRPLDDMSVNAENLVYDRNNDEITTTGSVVVKSKEGTIEGESFKGDLREKVYSFSSIGKGDFNLE